MKTIVLPVSCWSRHHLVLHVAADERVERAERLVVEHHLRVDRERAGEADALLHAARELVGELVRGRPRGRPASSTSRGPGEPLAPWARPAPRARRRRCRSRGGARAGRSAGTPSRTCAGAAGAARPGLPRSRPGRRSGSLPAVGSISLISVRTSVDLPEPERPITTKTSPGQTSNDTSRTATTQPVFARSSFAREVGVRRADDAVGVRAEDLPDPVRADQRLAAPVDAVALGLCLHPADHDRAAERAQPRPRAGAGREPAKPSGCDRCHSNAAVRRRAAAALARRAARRGDRHRAGDPRARGRPAHAPDRRGRLLPVHARLGLRLPGLPRRRRRHAFAPTPRASPPRSSPGSAFSVPARSCGRECRFAA